MLNLVELFQICANRKGYTTVTPENHKYEVDYKFLEDVEERTLYIFFEPSDGKVDWRVNFSYWRKPYKDMEINYRVHGGFLESWKLIKDVIIEKIKEQEENSAEYRWRKVVTVGYSHGGALAVLCHECVWFERPDLRDGAVVGYSFDGPRVFAGLWIKKELKERWRDFIIFRNHGDIVTHLPPVVFGFRHVGTKVRIGAGKNPGLIGAHYPDKILASLTAYMKEGPLSIKETTQSVVEGIQDTCDKILDRMSDKEGD